MAGDNFPEDGLFGRLSGLTLVSVDFDRTQDAADRKWIQLAFAGGEYLQVWSEPGGLSISFKPICGKPVRERGTWKVVKLCVLNAGHEGVHR